MNNNSKKKNKKEGKKRGNSWKMVSTLETKKYIAVAFQKCRFDCFKAFFIFLNASKISIETS